MTRYNDLHTQAQERWNALVNGELPVIYLGTASCGRAAGALEVLQSIQETLERAHLRAHIVQVGCIGPCYLEPLMDIALPGKPRVSYARVTPEKAQIDSVIHAIGNSPNPLIPATTPGLEIAKRGNVVIDAETGKTSKERVWAGGDIATGAATVIQAMGAGRKAANSIHAYLTSPTPWKPD